MKKKLLNWLIQQLQDPRHWNVGDTFTVAEWIGKPDRSWIGRVCKITKKDGNIIWFKSPPDRSWENPVGYRIGVDFNIRPI